MYHYIENTTFCVLRPLCHDLLSLGWLWLLCKLNLFCRKHPTVSCNLSAGSGWSRGLYLGNVYRNFHHFPTIPSNSLSGIKVGTSCDVQGYQRWLRVTIGNKNWLLVYLQIELSYEERLQITNKKCSCCRLRTNRGQIAAQIQSGRDMWCGGPA